MQFNAREPRASPWLDLAEGRLRLDRLGPQRRRRVFLPLGFRPFLARHESPAAAVLRSRFGPRADASSIASGRSIAIEAAVVAVSRTAKET